MDELFHYDKRAAAMAVAFFEVAHVNVKGEWAHQAFKLQPWQRKIVSNLFGWKQRDGIRRYRKAYIEVPRKNGPSTISAGIAFYLLCADGEYGAGVFSAAADREQAAIVFETAKQMVELSPMRRPRTELFKRSIFCAENMGSQYRIAEVAFDRWGATRISTQLEDAGFTMEEFGEGYASMSAPTKELLRLVLGARIGH